MIPGVKAGVKWRLIPLKNVGKKSSLPWVDLTTDMLLKEIL
jgi:hypothetical protein